MKKSFKILSAIFLLLALDFSIPYISVVSICNRKNPKQRVYSTDAFNDGFCISYTHSVNKGRVHDYYICDKNNKSLILTQTHFVSYGAGIPEPEETKGADFKVLDNGYLISGINRKVPELVMAVGVIANHTFAISNGDAEKVGEPLEEISLTDYFAPQTSLIIQIKNVNLIEYQIHKIKNKK